MFNLNKTVVDEDANHGCNALKMTMADGTYHGNKTNCFLFTCLFYSMYYFGHAIKEVML